jgi:hypothetical protein
MPTSLYNPKLETLCSKEPAIALYPKLVETSPHLHALISLRSILILLLFIFYYS